MADLKVGDRVRLVYNKSTPYTDTTFINRETGKVGLTGVIRYVSNKTSAVELDNPVLANEYIRLWDCNGEVPSKKGRCIQNCCLELVEEVVTGVLSIGEGIL